MESREFSEPDRIPAEPAWLGLLSLLAEAAMPNRVDMKALPAAMVWSLAEAGRGVVGEEELFRLLMLMSALVLELLELTTHLRMCFSSVEGTLKGMAQKRHL